MNDGIHSPVLLCDAMLGTLAKWLRFFGFDCEYGGVEASDEELGDRAEAEGRWLLTCDRELASRGPRTVLVRSIDLEDQLVEVFRRLGLAPEPTLESSRCSVCNGELVDTTAEAVEKDVPPYVRRTAQRFKRCRACRAVVWPGTHGDTLVARMRRVAERVEQGATADPPRTNIRA